MQRRTAAACLVAASGLLLLSQLRLLPQDQGVLLEVSGRPVDAAGQLQAGGVWSGDTGPWSAPVFIRRFLADRLPALPAPLRQCLDPQLLPFSS